MYYIYTFSSNKAINIEYYLKLTYKKLYNFTKKKIQLDEFVKILSYIHVHIIFKSLSRLTILK